MRINPGLRYLGLVDGDDTTFLFLNDNVVTPFTVAVGNFQRDDLRRVIELCKKIGSPLGGLFVDVGANIGTSTLYALRSGSFERALCIEPAPANLKLLRLNMQTNGLEGRVHVRANAVSNKQGTMTLTLSTENCGDHRISGKPTTSTGETVEVEVDTLDDILVSERIIPTSVSLVWVDTQGHEGFVLKGAASLIRGHVPFCIEFWPQAMQEANSYETLLEIIERDFETFVDLNAKGALAFQSTASIRSFARRFEGTVYHTDLYLVPRS